ncbi:MAG: DUF4194 domain-containing protein [Pseudomonadota bacterium]|nr:DUF4194 domain-containing protein [Pseudomonadota bacterium]
MAGIFDRITGAAGKEVRVDEQMKSDLNDDAMLHDEGAQAVSTPSAAQDEERTPQRVRDAAQELLKYGLLEQAQKPNLYRLALNNPDALNKILEPLDLQMAIDDVRGLAYVVVRHEDAADEDDWSHPLVRRQRLNLEQSLLVAILRRQLIAHEQSCGTGASDAQVALDELIPELQVYLGDLGSDARERNRVLTLLEALKGHGLVSGPDAHDRVLIRPIIAHLANPENLQVLLAYLHTQAGVSGSDVDDAIDDQADTEAGE